MAELFDINQLWYLVRIVVASICGLLIGLERKGRSKEAGIRTHCVVACAAALMMIISKYAFFDVIGEGMYSGVEVRLDPSRVASTIGSGIGFLGAGIIFVNKGRVTGLTTAAGIWATSGVGMAIGSGMYVIGISATVIIILAQVLLHMDFKRHKNDGLKKLALRNVDEIGFQAKFMKVLEEQGILVHGVDIEKQATGYDYTFLIELPMEVEEESVISLTNYKCKITSNVGVERGTL